MRKPWCLSFCVLLCVELSGLVPNTHAQDALTVRKRDIIFLIDGSQNMGNILFTAIREFIRRFTEIMPIGPDQVQVGVAQFTNTPKLEMDLNTHSTKESLSTAVGRLRVRGGTQSVNIGAALEFVRTQMLRADKGSRISQGVPQLVLLLSAKKSTDSVAQQAEELHRLGVLTMAAGSKGADEQELKQIAFDKSLVFMFKDFRQLVRYPKIIVSPLSTLSAAVVTEQPTEPTLTVGKRDIIFLIDGSQNMGNTLFNAIREFIKRFAEIMPIGPDQVQVGVAQFTNTPKLEMDLNTHSTKESLSTAVGRLRVRGGTQSVNIGVALEFVRTQMLRVDKGSRISQGVPQLVLLLSAKKSIDSVAQQAEELHRLGVLTMAAGSKGADEQELKQIAFDKSLVFMFKDFRQLLRNPKIIVSPLSTLSAAVVTKQPTEPTLTVGKRDIIFLIDGSQNMGNTLFNAIREFIKRFAEIMPIGPGQVQVGVAQFTNTPKLEMDLNTHSTKESLSTAVGRLRVRGGTQSVNIGAALEFVRTQMLRADKGSRISQGVPQLVLLLSAKKSTDSVAQQAEELHRLGVLTMAAGSKGADEQELKQIAFDKSLVFMFKDFRQLLRNPKIIVSPLSTLSAAVVTKQPTEPTLTVGKRDIIFLIDGSQNMGNTLFNAIREFIKRFAEIMPIGPGQVQVGVAQFTNTPKLEMDLNTHSTKESLSTAVGRLRVRGGTQSVNIGAALEFVRTQMLRAVKGSRISQGVPQLVLLLSAKKSTDSVAQQAKELHRLGVLTMAAGSKGADEQELKQIAFDKSLVFMFKDFRQLVRNPKIIVSPLSTLSAAVVTKQPTEPTLTVGKRDIIFLIDGSQNMGNTLFNAIREFIKRFAEIMPIGPDQVQVGVAQFTSTPKLEMDLNTHSTKESLSTAVGRLRVRGGTQSVNIGAALEFVRTQMLRADKGSRISQGVPQLVLLLSAKKSTDSVAQQAEELHRLGVLTMAAGSKRSDEQELKQIAFDKSLVFTFKDFRQLLRNPKIIVSPLSTLSKVVVTKQPTEPSN